MNGKEHPVVYVSLALSQQETHYAITGLEPLAVVLFLWLLYGSNHDHSALKAMLQTLSANGKRVRW